VNRDSKTGIVPEKKEGFTVKASPFNPVKLELGAILITGVVLLLIIDFLVDSRGAQLGILACYGFSAMAWLIIRVKKILLISAASTTASKGDNKKIIETNVLPKQDNDSV